MSLSGFVAWILEGYAMGCPHIYTDNPYVVRENEIDQPMRSNILHDSEAGQATVQRINAIPSTIADEAWMRSPVP